MDPWRSAYDAMRTGFWRVADSSPLLQAALAAAALPAASTLLSAPREFAADMTRVHAGDARCGAHMLHFQNNPFETFADCRVHAQPPGCDLQRRLPAAAPPGGIAGMLTPALFCCWLHCNPVVIRSGHHFRSRAHQTACGPLVTVRCPAQRIDISQSPATNIFPALLRSCGTSLRAPGALAARTNARDARTLLWHAQELHSRCSEMHHRDTYKLTLVESCKPSACLQVHITGWPA